MGTRTKVLIGAAAVVIVAIAGGLFWFFHDDAPAKVNLDTAAKSVATTTTAAGTGSTTDGSTTAGLDGTWKVDTTTGSFDFESATGTFVGFRIKENLAGIGSTTAVGRTGDVTGSMTIAGTRVSAAKFDVDVTMIKTNKSQRDQRVQQALETDQFPTATFELTSPIELGADAASGKEIDVTAKGNLTLHGVTKAVEFPLQAKLVNGTVVVVGSLDVKFSDYGIEVPSAPIVLSVDDHGTLELQLLLTKN
jgi:polyisoprenoid-binding protein YceI